MENFLDKISKTVFKVKRRFFVEAKYVTRKAHYVLLNQMGWSERDKNKRLVGKADNYKLQVFLSHTLDEISEIIQKDESFYELVIGAGERTCNDEWLVLNSYRKGMYDAGIGHYRWTEDFFADYNYKDCFYMDARKQKTAPNTDVKIPWETSRMQCLFALALAYRATRNEKYAQKAKEIIIDFDACCPVGQGVNWNVSMEVGIRIANILLACELMWDSAIIDAEFKRFLAITVYEHMKHIRQNMENEKEGGNHLLADLLGLAAATSAMPFLPGVEEYTSYVHKMLHREIQRQILPDGGHFEGSVSYHRLVGEILCFSIKAQINRGFILTADERERLYKMGEFTSGLRMDNGLLPQLGDNDSGRVFQLIPENTRNHDSFINLVSCLTRNSIVYPQKQDGFFCFYASDTLIDPSIYPQRTVQEFPCFKLLRYRGNGIFLTFSGMTPESYNKSGHSHNDVLSFTLAIGNDEIITDPGSGEYTGNIELRQKMRSVLNHSTISVDGGEQRVFPKDPALSFSWSSAVKSLLEFSQGDNGETIFAGECSYKNEKKEVITQKRTIVIDESLITIHDRLTGMVEECSLHFPVFPGVETSVIDTGISIEGKESKLNLEGSYVFSQQPSMFATQYKQVELCEVIKCKSNSDNNLLRIKILEK